MTSCNRGDIVLVHFISDDAVHARLRPALVISTGGYHESRGQAVVLAITSHMGPFLPGTYRIRAWRESGLPAPAMVSGIIRTINHDMLTRTLGALPDAEMAEVEVALSAVLGL